MKFCLFIVALSTVSAVKILDVPQWDDGKTARLAGQKAFTASDIVIDKIPEGRNSIKPSSDKKEGKGPTFAYKFSNDSNGPHKVEVFKHLTRGHDMNAETKDLVDGEEQHWEIPHKQQIYLRKYKKI